MDKKDQEVSSKNIDLDKSLYKTRTIGLDADKNVKTTIKYFLTALPANPNLSYAVSAIEIKKEHLEETLGEDISASLV